MKTENLIWVLSNKESSLYFEHMKTLLVGNFGADNVGDELILLAALEVYPESLVMTSNPEFSQTFTERTFETISMTPTGFRSMLQRRDVARNVSGIEKIVL